MIGPTAAQSLCTDWVSVQMKRIRNRFTNQQREILRVLHVGRIVCSDVVPDSLESRESIVLEIYTVRQRNGQKIYRIRKSKEYRRESKQMIDKTVSFDE
jgi:hypothetical protein